MRSIAAPVRWRSDAPMAPPAGVHYFLFAAEALDLLGDEALVPSLARRLDLAFAVVQGAQDFLHMDNADYVVGFATP